MTRRNLLLRWASKNFFFFFNPLSVDNLWNSSYNVTPLIDPINHFSKLSVSQTFHHDYPSSFTPIYKNSPHVYISHIHTRTLYSALTGVLSTGPLAYNGSLCQSSLHMHTPPRALMMKNERRSEIETGRKRSSGGGGSAQGGRERERKRRREGADAAYDDNGRSGTKAPGKNI